MKNLTQTQIETAVKILVNAQRNELKESNYSREDLESIIFSENDVVETFLRDNEISEESVDLESLRNYQHTMVQGLV